MTLLKQINLKGILFIGFFFALFSMITGMEDHNAFLYFLLCFIAFLLAGAALSVLIPKIPGKVKRFLSGAPLSDKLYDFCSDRELRMLFWFPMVMFFAPAYLALFPGTYGYDVPVQVAQYFGEIPLNAGNPLLHTYLVGIFISFGEKVLQSAGMGFALFCLIQGLLATNALAGSLVFLKRRNVPFTVILCGFLWVLLNPTLHVLTFSATKDILLGVVFLHFTMHLIEALEREDRKGYIRLGISALLLCLLRNAGIYLIIAVLLFGILLLKRKSVKLSVTLFGVVVICKIVSLITTYALDIPPAELRENLNLPIQQLAVINRDYHYNPASVNATAEEMELIEKLIPVALLDNMEDDGADAAKAAFQTDVFLENPVRYLSLYLSVGRKNLSTFGYTFHHLIIPYFDMTKSNYRGLAMMVTFMGMSHVDIRYMGLLEPYFDFLREQLETIKYPVLIQPGITIYLMTAALGLAMRRKNKQMVLGVLPVIIYFVGLLFGPVALLRYLYPMMLVTPLLFGTLFESDNS